ncbi:MAG TPA: hypothetical protein VK420_07185, partial [Longimicrobium sp.]|nr:hypothetical protein [Longimicrobium sp.]
ALALRTLERLGRTDVAVELSGKGEHVHADTVRARLRAARPEALLVLDMGSRGEPILEGLPTLVVDHHQPRGFPPGAVVVSAFGHEPVAPTGLLAYELFSGVTALDDLAWLALLGTVADLGTDAPFSAVPALLRRHGRKNVTEAVALLNAPRRHGDHDVACALSVLLGAREPSDIAQGRVEGVDRLRAYRAEVAAEVSRCSKTRPLFAGRFALLAFQSRAKVHPLVAQRWLGRLRGKIVIAANFDYLPGKVNFAMRSTTGENLIELLRGLPLPLRGDVAHGHPRATGGSLTHPEFAHLLEALGFTGSGVEARP